MFFEKEKHLSIRKTLFSINVASMHTSIVGHFYLMQFIVKKKNETNVF